MTDGAKTSKKASRYDQLASDGTRAVVSLIGPSLPELALSNVRIERSPSKLIFEGKGWQKDVTHWLSYDEICQAFVSAIEIWSPRRRSNTVFCRIDDLDRGFFRFLAERNIARPYELKIIDTHLISDFTTWLGRKNADGVPVWKPTTRKGILTSFRVLISSLKGSRKWKHRFASSAEVPTHLWPGSRRQSKPREVLDDVTLLQLLVACRDEVIQTMTFIRTAWNDVSALNNHPPDLETVPTSPDSWRWLHSSRYVSYIPTSDWIKENDQQLWLAYRRLSHFQKEITFTALRRPLTPASEDLVPFVLLLGFVTGFNPDVVRGLKFGEIDYPDYFGGQRIRFRPAKGRAKSKQLRSYAMGDPLGPEALVSFIREWTHCLRVIAPAELKNHLFLLATRGPKNADRGMLYVTDYTGGGHKAGSIWYEALRNFLKKHDLPQLSLAQLRPTSLDQIHEMTGGDLKSVQVAGGQRSPQVILDHYTSDAARKRNDEALAHIMLTRERQIGTKGAATDPRKEPRHADKGCATPGFYCLDPFASPLEGEIEGRLCQGFGMCPGCFLACVNRKDPYSAARAIQLRKAIMNAQVELEPRRWIDVWAPIAKKLDAYWLPLFDEPVLAEAAKLSPPPLLPLE